MKKIVALSIFALLFRVECSPCKVSDYAGDNLSQKINAAILALPAEGGVLNVDVVGEITQSIVVPDNVQLRFGYGTYQMTSEIALGAQSSIIGVQTGVTSGNGPYGTFFEAGANLNELVLMSGEHSSLQNVILDGNKTQYVVTNLVSVTGGRTDIQNVTFQNSGGNGLALQPGSDVAKIFNIMSIANLQSGLLIKANDVFVLQSEFENNTLDGITLSGGSALRVSNSDFGGNHRYGLYTLNGSSVSGINIISSNQFGNNYQTDLYISGSTGHNVVNGNSFMGSGNRLPGQSAIIIYQNSGNVISGNMVFMVNGLPLAYGVHFINPGSYSNVTGNLINNWAGAGVPITAPAWMPMSNNVIIQ